MRRISVLVALLAGSALAASALAQGTSQVGTSPAGTLPAAAAPGGAPPAVVATPVPGTTAGGVVATTATPAPGTAPGAPLPVGRNGPVTAGMTFGGPQPNAGRNSFTRVQAARRIGRAGFTDVTGLQKDVHGVWRGHAIRGGASAPVWLDYTGRVGTT